jgi:PAS domain S-box-containing protein
MEARTQVKALGGLAIVAADGSDRRLPTRKARALAVYLAVHAGQRLPRTKLATLLWADEREASARHSLRQALSSIRAVFGADAVLADEEWVSCRPGVIAVDAIEFEQRTDGGTLEAIEEAAQIYCGDFLEGQEIGEPAFDEWLLVERERLKDVARRNLGQLLVRRTLDPDLEAAINTARRLIQLDPFDEAVHRSLMLLYVRQRRTTQAIRHFRNFSRCLRQELGVAPDPQTMTLHEAIRVGRGETFAPASLAESAFVLEQVPHCVVVTDLCNHIVGWNKAAEQAFGFTKDDMCGRKPTLLYAPARDQSLADAILKTALANGKWSQNVRLLSKDGRETHQVRTVAPLHDRAGQLIGAFGVGTPSNA